MTESLSSQDAVALLAWQVELGADEATLDEPINRYELDAKAPTPPKVAQTAPPPTPDPVDPKALAILAAKAASDIEGLAAALHAFEGSDLKAGARNTVVADGLAGARTMIIGEAPGREEDRIGKPFVGQAGQLLDRMFASIGLSRETADPAAAFYITNVIPWRPPQNRTPTPQEIAVFLPFLERHIELADPDFIVVMGNTPAQAILGQTGITKLRGNWQEAHGRPVLPMLHPAYLLRQPHAKRDSWADLLSLKARLAAT